MSVPTDRESLRQFLIDGAARIRNSAVWRFMSADQRSVAAAVAFFWQKTDATADAALDAILALLPSARKEPPA